MTYKVRIEPSGHEMHVEPGETLLEAALRQGFNFPYGCRNGACGSCKGKIVSGEVDYGQYQAYTLTEEEKALGMALFCAATPCSDLVVEVREIGAAKDIQVKTLPARVARIEDLTPDVRAVYLKPPATERLQFLAGQYIDILLKNGKRRGFSLAGSPLNDEFLELHIKRVKGGEFTEHVFTTLKEKDIWRFEGPLGSFYLRLDTDRPIVMMATGTGFAPIKGMLEYGFAEGLNRPVHLYWGVRYEHDFYRLELIREWQAAHPQITFVPVVSRPSETWTGRTGYVTEAIMQDFADLSGFDAYLCGHPEMVAEGARRLQEKGLPGERIFSDAFTFASQPKMVGGVE